MAKIIKDESGREYLLNDGAKHHGMPTDSYHDAGGRLLHKKSRIPYLEHQEIENNKKAKREQYLKEHQLGNWKK
jgi:hypothetical protein